MFVSVAPIDTTVGVTVTVPEILRQFEVVYDGDIDCVAEAIAEVVCESTI